MPPALYPIMGNSVKILDLARKLGLVAPVTKKRDDWPKCPEVRTLYETGLDGLAVRFREKSNVDLRVSAEFRQAVDALFDQYAPTIWRRDPGGDRPWLYTPDAIGAEDHYPRHLFYNDVNHRKMWVNVDGE
jgi:hypothetical protein